MKTLTILLSLTALGGLSACASNSLRMGQNESPATVLDAYNPHVYQTDAQIQLAVHAQGLSNTQADALGQFAVEWNADQGGMITLRAPEGGSNSPAAFRTAEGARAFMIRQGIPPDRIAIAGYDARGLNDPNLIMSYTHYKVEALACNRSWKNLASLQSNEPSDNFGCAVHANMYAQLADPADLAHPRESTPVDATRRLEVLALYRKGSVTTSAQDGAAKAAIK